MIRSVAPKLERSSGCTKLSFKSAPAGSTVDGLYQQGCCKVRFPRRSQGMPEAVLLNTSGGLADGDTVNVDVGWRRNTQALVTTQAAERVYRAATHDSARVTTRIDVSENSVACWLPQETIVFDGGRLARRLEIDLTSSGRLLALESTVFGRRAMGERVARGRISDCWRIRIDGQAVFSDHFLVDDEVMGPIFEFLQRVSVADMAHCLTTMVVIADDCEKVVEGVRKLEVPSDGVLAATCLGPLAVVRISANDSRSMRTAVGQVVASLGNPFNIDLPRVWHC